MNLKTHIPKFPIKVGKISKDYINIGVAGGSVYLEKGNDSFGYNHILRNHEKELFAANSNPKDFAKWILENFTSIHFDLKNNTYWIVFDRADKKSNKVVYVSLKKKANKNYYTVISEGFKKKNEFKKVKFLCSRTPISANTLSGLGEYFCNQLGKTALIGTRCNYSHKNFNATKIHKMTNKPKNITLGKFDNYKFSPTERAKISREFNPITNLDYLVLFIDGVKFSPESFDRFFDSNMRKKGAQAFNLRWIKKGGAKIDQLAMSAISEVQGYNNADQTDTINDIVDLVSSYPGGFTEYFYDRINEDNQEQNYMHNSNIEDTEAMSNDAFAAEMKKLHKKSKAKTITKTVTNTVIKTVKVASKKGKAKTTFTPEFTALKRVFNLHNKKVNITQLTSLVGVCRKAVLKATEHKFLLKTLVARLDLAIFKLEGIKTIQNFEIGKDLFTKIEYIVKAPKVKEVTLGGAAKKSVKGNWTFGDKKKLAKELGHEFYNKEDWKKLTGKQKPSSKSKPISGLSRSQKAYNKEVDLYKWYVVDLKAKKAITGYEFKQDAIDETNEQGKYNFKVIAKSALKKFGIEIPNEKWKGLSGSFTVEQKQAVKDAENDLKNAAKLLAAAKRNNASHTRIENLKKGVAEYTKIYQKLKAGLPKTQALDRSQTSLFDEPKKAQTALFGIFEPTFNQFKGKPVEAIKHLQKEKKGQCTEALYRADVGFVDIVWGENNSKTNVGFGLKHIIEKHGNEIKELGFDVANFIATVFAYGELKQHRMPSKILLDSKLFRLVVKTEWNGNKKAFVLTAFDLRKKALKSNVGKRTLGALFSNQPLSGSLNFSTANVNKNNTKKANNKTDANTKKSVTHSPFGTMDKLTSGGTYQLNGELGKLLGNLGEVDTSITIKGDQGAGKSRLMWQLVNAFTSIGKRVAIVSTEMNGNSPTISNYRDEYLSEENKAKILFTDKKLSAEEILKLSNNFDVVFVDSFGHLKDYKQEQFEWLAKQLPSKAIIGLFQSTTSGEMRGGNKPEFDAYINIECIKVDDTFKNNYAVCTKNRFGSTGEKYNISLQKIQKPNALSGVTLAKKAVGKSAKKVTKSVEASKVLKLIDDDYSYQDALKLVLSNNKKISKSKLEKELNKYI